jgi:hypothetical protein
MWERAVLLGRREMNDGWEVAGLLLGGSPVGCWVGGGRTARRESGGGLLGGGEYYADRGSCYF